MPILGYDTAGVSMLSNSHTQAFGCADYVDAIGGIITTFHAAVGAIHASSKNIKICVANCDQGTGNPSEKALIEQVEFAVEISDDENTLATGTEGVVASTRYWIGFMTESVDTRIKYDDVGGYPAWRKVAYPGAYAAFADDPLPIGFVSFGARAISIWVDYKLVGILGYNTVGASWGASNTRCYGDSHSMPGVSGNILAFHCAVGQVDATPAWRKIKLVVHDCQQSDGDPTGYSPIEQVEFLVEVSDDERIEAPEGNLLDADTKYWLAFTPYSGSNKVKYDGTGGEGHWYNYTIYADEFIDPRAGTHNIWALLFSIWVVYEEVGGQEYVRSIVDTIGITDNLLRSVVFTRKMVDTINISDILISVRIRVRKIIDTVGITDVLSYITTIARKTDSFGVCQIIEVKEKSIGALKEVIFPKISKIVQSIAYNNPKVKQIKKYMKPIINEIRGIKK